MDSSDSSIIYFSLAWWESEYMEEFIQSSNFQINFIMHSELI